MFSRQHCRLSRVDFGPSKWSITDNQSTNGLFVNGRRVEFKELSDGDVIRIGQYELQFGHAVEQEAERELAPAPAPPTPRGTTRVTSAREAALTPVVPGTGVICASCERELPSNAKICVTCGIKLDTGRPVLLSAGTDEDY